MFVSKNNTKVASLAQNYRKHLGDNEWQNWNTLSENEPQNCRYHKYNDHIIMNGFDYPVSNLLKAGKKRLHIRSIW